MESSTMRLTNICYALAVVFAVSASAFFFKLYIVRSKTLQLQRSGLVMPPLHPILGHLLVCYHITSRLPKDAHPHYLPDQIRRAMPELGPLFYIDAWPFLTPTLVVLSPSTLHQITQAHSLPKFPAIRDFLKPLTDGRDIVSMDGQEWKTWRNVFNPGFSASHLMTLVPEIVKETTVFCTLLREHAQKRDIFTMKSLTDNLAADVIGRVVLDTNLDSQQTNNEMVKALRDQMRWLTFGDEGFPLRRYHPLRPFILAYNAYQMNKYLSPYVDARFAIHLDKERTKAGSRNKSVVDLALTAYLDGKAGERKAHGMDSAFKAMVMSQIKLFLFSGLDTTSSSICYIFYNLSTHPSVLDRIRAEHDQIFGSEIRQAATLMSRDPYLLNKIPYTAAVIRETLRLFPAASTTRAGEPGFNITDARGLQYPTNGYLIWLVPQAIQRDPAFWPHPDEFLPERWLASPKEPLYPVSGAWRPFEHGPRSCIGQELSMIEMKIVMVLTLREFAISGVYEELDQLKAEARIPDSQPALKTGKRPRTVDGERAYQIGLGQPSGNLPCRVSILAG